MGEVLMKQEELEAIGGYVKDHIEQWIKEKNISLMSGLHERDISLTERIVRVEEGIKHQGELLEKMLYQIDKRFDQIEKRFEQIDKRFEQVEKRFEQVDKRFEELRNDMNTRFSMMFKIMTLGFGLLAFLITLFQYI